LDGRNIISGDKNGWCFIWDVKTGNLITSFRNSNEVNSICLDITENKALVANNNNMSTLWDFKKGIELTCFFSSSKVSTSTGISNGFILGCVNGEIIFLHLQKAVKQTDYLIANMKRIWQRGNDKKHLTVDCPYCKNRFHPDQKLINSIHKILLDNHIHSEESPILNLSKESWNHPKLISNCPNCNSKLKYNPFIAGGDEF
jgi:WD40 repeat protein